MPDIIVTTPRSRMAEAAAEAEDIKKWGGGYYIRGLGPLRPTIAAGDRVYYVENGYVRGFALVSSGPFRVGGWKAYYEVHLDATTWRWIRPRPMTGFQGWRYAPAGWRDAVEVLGDWLAPRPDVWTLGVRPK